MTLIDRAWGLQHKIENHFSHSRLTSRQWFVVYIAIFSVCLFLLLFQFVASNRDILWIVAGIGVVVLFSFWLMPIDE